MSKAPMKIWSTLRQCKIATTQTVLTMILGPIISALLLDKSGHNKTLFKNVLPLKNDFSWYDIKYFDLKP
jgi:hypothetical protein